MADVWDLPGTGEWDSWLLQRVGPTGVPRIALFGAAKSGKTAYFRGLSVRQPHRNEGIHYCYWDLLATPEARTAEGFWRTAGHLLAPEGIAKSVGSRDDLVAALGLMDTAPEHRIVLVLDDWDHAREYGAFVDLGALQQLTDFVVSQEQSYDLPVSLGLLLVTSFPNRDLLVKYAHRFPSAGLLRISGLIARHFRAASWPMLSCASARAFLEGRGVSAPDAREIVRDCGGWLGLLEQAVATRQLRLSGESAKDRRDQLAGSLPTLLGPLLRIMKADWELPNYEQTWSTVLRRIRAEEMRPVDLGLPTSCDPDPSSGLAPILEEFARPPEYLVVDCENLRMIFEARFKDDPKAFPDGVNAVTQAVLPKVIRALAERHRIAEEHVVVVGKSDDRIHRVMGEASGPWKKLTPLTDQHRGENDDAVLAAQIGHLTGQDPRTRIVLVTGDGNATLLLANFVQELTCYAPYELGSALKAKAPPGWKLRPRLFADMSVPL